MGYGWHLLIGSSVGLIQYLQMFIYSYLLISCRNEQLVYILLLCAFMLIVILGICNIFIKVKSFKDLFLRIVSSLFFYIAAWICVVCTGALVALEKHLNIGSGSQNIQGMVLLAFILGIIVASLIAIPIKCIVIRNTRGQGDGSRGQRDNSDVSTGE